MANQFDVIKLDDLFKYINITDGCWIWIGARNKSGYGIILRRNTNGYKHYYVHRIMYEKFIDELGNNLVIDHLCEVKNCVNPFHLEQITSGENTRRSTINKYNTMIYCTKNHKLVPENIAMYKTKYGLQRRCKKCNVINALEWRKKKRLLT